MVRLNFCKCGKIHVPNDVKEAVKRGEKITANILPQTSGIAKNVLKHGCGGLNIDASRVSFDSKEKFAGVKDPFNHVCEGEGMTKWVPGADKQEHSALLYKPEGRFPANLVLSHNDDCVEVGVKKVKGDKRPVGHGAKGNDQSEGWGTKNVGRVSKLTGQDGTETVSAFECTPFCAVAELDRQSGILKSGAKKKSHIQSKPAGNGLTHGKMGPRPNVDIQADSGGASRFFYCAKASKREKNEGCEGLPEKVLALSGGAQAAAARGESYDNGDSSFNKTKLMHNHHPTVKPTKLMSYLITMITPPNGLVLDPFMGSGSTGVAALKSGFQFIGIEKDESYVAIANHRIDHVILK